MLIIYIYNLAFKKKIASKKKWILSDNVYDIIFT